MNKSSSVPNLTPMRGKVGSATKIVTRVLVSMLNTESPFTYLDKCRCCLGSRIVHPNGRRMRHSSLCLPILADIFPHKTRTYPRSLRLSNDYNYRSTHTLTNAHKKEKTLTHAHNHIQAHASAHKTPHTHRRLTSVMERLGVMQKRSNVSDSINPKGVQR